MHFKKRKEKIREREKMNKIYIYMKKERKKE